MSLLPPYLASIGKHISHRTYVQVLHDINLNYTIFAMILVG